MRDLVCVTGMVLISSPVRDYDKRLVILTRERGKITVFANGVRRQGNRSMAATDKFAFGNFKLYEGKDAYNLSEAEISYYFEELRNDFDGACLGMYFLEFADYYTRENNDETDMLKLLFQSIRAIIKDTLDNRLVRTIFEIKAMCINGEFPGIPDEMKISDAAAYAINYIVNTPVEKLYTFSVTDSVLAEMAEVSQKALKRVIDRNFKSLEMLDALDVM